jgi:hypothetical protein
MEVLRGAVNGFAMGVGALIAWMLFHALRWMPVLAIGAGATLLLAGVASAQTVSPPTPGTTGMDAQAVLTVGAAVVALTQLIKWGGLPDKAGPLAVLILAALGVGVWAYQAGGVDRTQAFTYFSGWISVALTAAGVFGFTRASVSAVTSAKPPPATGAGSNPTIP